MSQLLTDAVCGEDVPAAIAPVDDASWVLDLDASHGEREFDSAAIVDQVQLFSDRIYRYFRWVVTDDFLTSHGAAAL